MNVKTLLTLLVLASSSLWAQQKKVKVKFREPTFIIKFSPLQLLLSNYPTFQVALEYQFNKRYSIQVEAGPSIESNKITSPPFTQRHGYKAMLNFRKYIANPSKLWRIYYGPEVYYNHINYRKTDFFGVNCIDGKCDGEERLEYGMHYREAGLYAKSGAMFKVYRFSMDIHVGVALRFIKYTEIDKPENIVEGFSDYSFLDFEPIEQSRIDSSPFLGISFGYILK